MHYLIHSACQRQGRGFGMNLPYPKILGCAGSLGSCLKISRLGHSTLGYFTEMEILGTEAWLDRGAHGGLCPRGTTQEGILKGLRETCTWMIWMSLGNISEWGKERMQRIVLKCL